MARRTLKQNNSIHKFCDQLADTLNDAGLDQRAVLKETVEIPWTMEAVKRQMWKPIQNLMYDIESTTELTTDQVSKVWETMNRHLGQKFGVHVPFPSEESKNE